MPTLLSRTQPAPGPRVKHEPEPISRNILQAFVFVTRGGIWNPASHNRSRSSYIQKRVHGLLPRSRIHAPMWTETYDTALGLGQAFASRDFFCVTVKFSCVAGEPSRLQNLWHLGPAPPVCILLLTTVNTTSLTTG